MSSDTDLYISLTDAGALLASPIRGETLAQLRLREGERQKKDRERRAGASTQVHLLMRSEGMPVDWFKIPKPQKGAVYDPELERRREEMARRVDTEGVLEDLESASNIERADQQAVDKWIERILEECACHPERMEIKGSRSPSPAGDRDTISADAIVGLKIHPGGSDVLVAEVAGKEKDNIGEAFVCKWFHVRVRADHIYKLRESLVSKPAQNIALETKAVAILSEFLRNTPDAKRPACKAFLINEGLQVGTNMFDRVILKARGNAGLPEQARPGAPRKAKPAPR